MIWMLGLVSGGVAISAALPSTTAGVPLRVAGVVTSSVDGSPVPHCKVSLFPALTELGNSEQALARDGSSLAARFQDQGESGRRGPWSAPNARAGEEESVVTDSHGRFILVAPHAGAWILSGTAHGFRAQRYEQHDRFSTRLVLTPASPEMKVNLVLRPNSDLSGTVLDEFGDAVTLAQVTIQRKVMPENADAPLRWQNSGSTQTDDRGHYEVANLEEGEYRVSVSARPWYASGSAPRIAQEFSFTGSADTSTSLDPSLDKVFPPTWYPGSTDEHAAAILKLSAGDVREANLQLQSVAAIHLTIPRVPESPVLDGNIGERRRGLPAPQIVRNDDAGGRFGLPQYTVVAKGAEWQIGGLSPGTYEVRVPESSTGGGQVMQVKLGNRASTTFDLSDATAMIPVTIKTESSDGKQFRSISLTDIDTGQRFFTTVRSRAGLFRVGGDGVEPAESLFVPPGKYYVTLQLSDGDTLSALHATGAELSGRVLHVSNTASVLTLVVQQGQTLVTGKAVLDGAASPGAMILLVPASYGAAGDLSEIRRDQSASDGSFLFKAVAPGPYLLVAVEHGWTANLHDPATLANFLGHGTPVVVPASGHFDQQLTTYRP